MFSNFEIIVIIISSFNLLLLLSLCAFYLIPLIWCMFSHEDRETKIVKKFHKSKVNMKEFNKMRADIQHIDEVLCNIDNKMEYFVHLKSMEKKNGKPKHTN